MFWKGTDPFVADTDGDGEPDFVEILEGRDPKQSDVKPKPRKRMLKAGREDPSTGIDAEPVPVTFSFGQNDNNPRCSQNYRLEVAPIFGAGESFVWVSGYHQMLDRVAMLIPEWRYFVRLSLEGLTYVSAEEDAYRLRGVFGLRQACGSVDFGRRVRDSGQHVLWVRFAD